MIYITGATGRLGRELINLIDAVPLVRKKSNLVNEKITSFKPNELKKILKNADAIIHLAGSMNFSDKKDLWKSNVELTKNIVDSLPEKTRIVFASSISVYGKKPVKMPVDEKTPVNPDTDYSKSKLEAEEIISRHKNHVILRLGTMYGMNYGEYFRILKLINQGKMAIIGDGKNRISFVHVEDVAKAVKNSLKAKTGTYVVAGESLPQEKIYEIAAKELKVGKPKKKIPKFVALLLTWFYEKKASLSGKKLAMTSEHIKILSSDRVFRCSKAEKELKFKPRSISDGIRSMVAETKL